MRRHVIRRVLSGTVFAVSGVLGQAQAGYLDFEPITPAIFLPGETFQQGHYTFTLGTEVGQVDTTAGFVGTTPPSGNSTQFFSAFNDGNVTLTDTFGVGFNLYGFYAGFIGPIPVDEGVSAGRIIVDAITLEGGQVITSFDLGLSGADGAFAFQSFGSLGGFTSLASVTFSACLYDELGGCVRPADNLAQFSLDNLNVIAVPEPSTYALMVAGLAGLAAYRRRERRR